MQNEACLGFALATILAAGAAEAQSGPAPVGASVEAISTQGTRFGDRLSAEGYLGYLTGESHESVYNDGQRVSRLDWEIKDALVLGTRLSYQATSWLTLDAGGWTSLAADAKMTDYDWLWSDRDDWSDRSIHPDTDLRRAFEVDLGARARVIERDGFWLDGMLGYQLRNFQWRASNGSYLYSRMDWHDDSGEFSGPQVDYEQWWRTPYIGVGGGYALPWLRLSGRVIASPFAQVSDSDTHIENQQRFTGDFDSTQMAAVTLRAEHDIGPRLTLTGEANYQKFWEARGDMTVNYLNLDGWRSELNDAAGASNQTLIFSLGLDYRF